MIVWSIKASHGELRQAMFVFVFEQGQIRGDLVPASPTN